jgi:multidrug efflux pump subunit AcrB
MLLVGIAVLVLFQDNSNIAHAFIKFIGLCLTLISAFLIICYFFGITLNRLE